MFKRILVAVSLLFLVWSVAVAQGVDSKIDDIKTALINGDYEAGLRECETLLELNISDTSQLALVYGYAGLSSEVLGRKTKAIQYYKNAVELQMPQLDVYDKLINLSKKEKNDSIYEFALQEKSRAFPEYNQDNTKSLAYHYLSTGQHDKLLSVTNKLLSWYPSDINYLFFKGIALQNLNQIEESKSYFTDVLKLNPDHSGANMSLGLIFYNDGSEIYSLRKKEYEAIAKPDRTDYFTYVKAIEKGKTLYKKALPYLLKAFESGSYPDLKPILFNTYLRLEQKDNAEPYR